MWRLLVVVFCVLVAKVESEDLTLRSGVHSRSRRFDTNGPITAGAIRLYNQGSTSQHYTAGRVQVWDGTQWGNICSDFSFGFDEANVICHHLGRLGASLYNTALHDSFGDDGLPQIISQMSCYNSGYLNIFQCSLRSVPSYSSCTWLDDVSVSCNTLKLLSAPYNGAIRLSRGEYTNQGLLEVYCNGQWGTVCSDGFQVSAATVACRQLGYDSCYAVNHLPIKGSNDQPVWFSYINCPNVSPSCIGNCARSPQRYYSGCSRHKVVTLECSTSVELSFTSTTKTTTCVRYANNGVYPTNDNVPSNNDPDSDSTPSDSHNSDSDSDDHSDSSDNNKPDSDSNSQNDSSDEHKPDSDSDDDSDSSDISKPHSNSNNHSDSSNNNKPDSDSNSHSDSDSEKSDDDHSLSVATIGGIVGGGVFVIMFLVCIVVVVIAVRKRKQAPFVIVGTNNRMIGSMTINRQTYNHHSSNPSPSPYASLNEIPEEDHFNETFHVRQ